MQPLTEVDMVARLGAAILAGCLMGLNRDLKGKPAGVRTMGLVGLGSALATMAATGLATGAGVNLDAISRAIQGIITGIGFLGAGVIIKEDGQRIRGLTTAATIWVTAAFGMVCGIGAWRAGGIALILALFLLIFGKSIERFAHWLRPERPDKDDEDKSVT